MHDGARRPIRSARACGAVGNPAHRLRCLYQGMQVGKVSAFGVFASSALAGVCCCRTTVVPNAAPGRTYSLVSTQVHLLALDRFS